MKLIGLVSLAILVSICVCASVDAQQWQLGHQPQNYTVPQYYSGHGQPGQPQIGPQDPVPPTRYPLYEAIPDPRPHSDGLSSEVLPAEPIPAGQAPSGNLIQPAPPALIVPPTSSLPHPADALQVGKPPIPGRYGLDYSIYRDYNPYPIDPRKPCNECTQGNSDQGLGRFQWPGKNGRPYQDREPGGCECAQHGHRNHDRFSLDWSAPFSALRDSHSQALDPCHALRPRINDRFNHLESFKLIDYRRTDNGYCGIGADPYGCLGESRVVGSNPRTVSLPDPKAARTADNGNALPQRYPLR